ncbi:MAG: helix-turn-helix transcriptional regulator [Proteobacteria bacterium]|nr:helix-turn-helix transcriptional regulator [Pseudomonadota bacterium]MBW3617620.1 helix-turn-helix transcriptional regulator [Pseudomonadota bacterium]
MPIRVRLDRMLVERRMSLTELADRVGVTLANLSILKTGKARAIRFSTLDALCRALDCQPGDLLVFEPGPPDSDEADASDGLEAEGSAPEGLRQRVLGARRPGRQKGP